MMNNNSIHMQRPWDVLLIGGAAGTGKTTISRRLAQHFAVNLTEVDDLHLVLATMTRPEQQPTLHYWDTHPEAHHFSAEEILDLHVAVGRVLTPAICAVINDHLEYQNPVILEGDYLLPELMVGNISQPERVRALFLYEADERQIVQNFYAREPEEGEQTGRAHVSWRFGQWLQAECKQHGIPAVPAMPWDNLFERVLAYVT